MLYAEFHDAAMNPSHVIRKQIVVAMQRAAAAVAAEDEETPNHEARLTWAGHARKFPTAATIAVLWRVLEEAGDTDLGTFTDAAVQAVIDGLVDEFTTM